MTFPGDQDGSQLNKNPFTPGRPVPEPGDFVGRNDAVEWIRSHLRQVPLNKPLTISGSRGVGKTSLLKYLAAGGSGIDSGVVYADIGSMNIESMSGFLWDLAKAIMRGLDSQSIDGPRIEKRMLVLNPQLVFRQRFWQPLLAKSSVAPQLLAWDNFDHLAEHTSVKHKEQAIRTYLYGLLDSEAPLKLLLTVTGRVEAIAENSLSPFRLEHNFRLTNLSHAHTRQLLYQSDQSVFFGPIVDFIYQLTAGHPGDLQTICYALYDRHLRRGHRQLTTADILATLQHELSPSDFHGAVYRRLSHISMAIGRPDLSSHVE